MGRKSKRQVSPVMRQEAERHIGKRLAQSKRLQLALLGVATALSAGAASQTVEGHGQEAVVILGMDAGVIAASGLERALTIRACNRSVAGYAIRRGVSPPADNRGMNLRWLSPAAGSFGSFYATVIAMGGESVGSTVAAAGIGVAMTAGGLWPNVSGNDAKRYDERLQHIAAQPPQAPPALPGGRV